MTMRHRIHRLTTGLACLLFVVTAGWSADLAAEETGDEFPWIVDAERGAELIEEGEVDVLDTRDASAWKKGHLPGAVRVNWDDFTPSEQADRGELLEEASALQSKVRNLGVDADRPVLVVGNPPENWGEDGRIVWMLRSLGHDRVALVDGGHPAVVEAGVEATDDEVDPETGDFEIERRSTWSTDREAIGERLEKSAEGFVLLDTRSAREYGGETPYGESRPGHLPGAKHLHYRDLLGADGRLLSADAIREKLQARGIQPDSRVVSYCTGGVRSAWLTVVLQHLGYDGAVNYAGSAWDWSAAPAGEYPLETE